MLTINQYVRAESLEQAYELCQKKRNVVLGGMLWLKMQHRNVETAIDLCDLGLDQITETPDSYTIGAMVSLRTLEQHAGLAALTQGAFAEALCHIVGVQFRNTATVGGSLFGRFGFSDVLTLFAVLDAKIELYHHGILSVAEFCALPRNTRDILVQVHVPKTQKRVVYLSQRNSATDFPVLTCAVALQDGKCQCAIGARPLAAVTFTDETGILQNGITPESAEAFGQMIAQKAEFGKDIRAGVEYRKRVCAVLVRRALLQAKEV